MEVYVEFTVTGCIAKNNYGSSLKLLSVVGYNFESPKKNFGCNSIVNLVLEIASVVYQMNGSHILLL